MGQGGQVYSPAKVTRMASLRSGFAADVSSDHRKDIEDMIRDWIDANGSDNIPAHLADLAERAQVNLSTVTTPQR